MPDPKPDPKPDPDPYSLSRRAFLAVNGVLCASSRAALLDHIEDAGGFVAALRREDTIFRGASFLVTTERLSPALLHRLNLDVCLSWADKATDANRNALFLRGAGPVRFFSTTPSEAPMLTSRDATPAGLARAWLAMEALRRFSLDAAQSAHQEAGIVRSLRSAPSSSPLLFSEDDVREVAARRTTA